MSFARFNVITDDDLHASLQCVSKIGSPIPRSVSRRSDAEASSSSGVPSAPQPTAGAAAAILMAVPGPMFEDIEQAARKLDPLYDMRQRLNGAGR